MTDGLVVRALLRAVLALLAYAAACSVVVAQDLPEELSSAVEPDSVSNRNPEDAPARAHSSSGAIDWQARAGYLAFQTVGRRNSITHVEVMPLVKMDDAALFSDFRLFVDHRGQIGGNVGVGYRVLLDEIDQVFGLSAWYDADQTTGEFFQQASVGAELLGDDWDVLINGYFPLGTTSRDFSVRNANVRISGNQILFDQIRNVGEAQPGLDLGAAVRLPGETGTEHDIRAYAGWYHFQGSALPTIDGVRARLSALITDNVSSQVEYTNDRTFGSNLIVGASLLLPGSYRSGSTRSNDNDHLKRFAQRNYNVIVSQNAATLSGIVAASSATGANYNVQHVSSSGSTGAAGTAVDPYLTLAEAQTAGASILFVQAGSVLPEAVVLRDGEFLLGEGVAHVIDAQGYGSIVLPGATSGAALPILQNVAGNAITLGDGGRVSGFVIETPTGNGIVASGIGDFVIDRVTVHNAGLDGILLQNLNGPATLSDVVLADASGASLHLDGTSSNVAVNGSIQNSVGRSLLIENTADNSLVDLSGTTVVDSGAGLLISQVDGDVTLKDVTVVSSSGVGIDVQGGNGNVTFNGLTSVNTASGAAIRIQDRVDDASVDGTQGQTLFAKMQITTSGQTGLLIRNAEAVGVGAGTVATVNGGAVADIEDSAIDVRLSRISANGGAFAVRVVDSTGLFSAMGDGTPGSGGLIQHTGTGLVLQNSGTVVLRDVDFDANQAVLSDIGSAQVSLSSLRVTQTSGIPFTTPAAFSLQNTRTFELVNSTFSNNSTGVLDAVFNTANSYSYALASNSVTSTVGDVFRLTSQSGAAGASLALQATSNLVTLNQSGTNFLNVNWNGPAVVDVLSNTVTGEAGSNTGFRFSNAATTDLATLTTKNNVFTFNGSSGAGANILGSGPIQAGITSNTFDFNGANGTAMAFTLNKASTVGIGSNLVTDDGSGATAVLFNMLANQSVIGVENNVFQFNTASAAVDRGFIISNVETGGSVTLAGSVNNLINGATTPYFIPVGTTTGGIPINGVYVP